MVIYNNKRFITNSDFPDSDFMGEGYLYFVLKSRTQDANDPDFGKLVFSKSYEDFLKNKEAYKNS